MNVSDSTGFGAAGRQASDPFDAVDGSADIGATDGEFSDTTTGGIRTSFQEPLVVTRSEERLRVGKQTRAVERVRLQKFIVTEERTITVTSRREEVRLVREPLDGARVEPADYVESGEEFTTVLFEEQFVVSKRIVPKERVRLLRHTVTENQIVTEDVLKERVDFDTITDQVV